LIEVIRGKLSLSYFY